MTRSEVLDDIDDVVGSPALASLAMLVVAIASLLQWLVPLDLIADVERLEDVDAMLPAMAGGTLAACGIALSIAGYIEMKRRAGDIVPWRPSSVLVTEGVYSWTRNPGYLGLWTALAGIGLAFGFDWLLVLVGPSSVLVNLVVVRREELSLAQKFGKQYLDYKDRVPRYLFIH